jgi:hypothetical protein
MRSIEDQQSIAFGIARKEKAFEGIGDFIPEGNCGNFCSSSEGIQEG